MKYGRILNHGLVNHVTPCAGVWIEMDINVQEMARVSVTPCAGVWIEIGYETSLDEAGKGHSLCGSVD